MNIYHVVDVFGHNEKSSRKHILAICNLRYWWRSFSNNMQNADLYRKPPIQVFPVTPVILVVSLFYSHITCVWVCLRACVFLMDRTRVLSLIKYCATKSVKEKIVSGTESVDMSGTFEFSPKRIQFIDYIYKIIQIKMITEKEDNSPLVWQ